MRGSDVPRFVANISDSLVQKEVLPLFRKELASKSADLLADFQESLSRNDRLVSRRVQRTSWFALASLSFVMSLARKVIGEIYRSNGGIFVGQINESLGFISDLLLRGRCQSRRVLVSCRSWIFAASATSFVLANRRTIPKRLTVPLDSNFERWDLSTVEIIALSYSVK